MMIIISKKEKVETISSSFRIDTPDGAEWTNELSPMPLSVEERERLKKYKVSPSTAAIIKRLKANGLSAKDVALMFKKKRGFSLSYIQKAFAALSDKKHEKRLQACSKKER